MNKELCFKNHEQGLKVAKYLLDENYVVMLSYEEDLLVVNYEWVQFCSRNGIVFMPRDEFEEKYVEYIDESD